MIIYYAMTKFHLIFSITHKFRVHKDEEAVLFLYSGLQDLETNHSRLKEKGIFSEVYIVPEIEFHGCWKPLKEDSSDKEIEYNINAMVAEIGKWLPVTISAQDRLYIANDHWALGTYCISKKIPYVYYEDGVGMLSKPEYSYELVKRVNYTHAAIAKHLNAFGLNSCVIEKLADLNNQTEGFFDEKAKHFSVKEQLKELQADEIADLLYIFDAPDCGRSEDASILLTEHFVNMRRLSIEGQRELYATLVDFFAKGKTLYIKPHPNDFQISYPDVFPDAKMISRKFPSELLPFCFSNQLLLALAACSTSVFGLQDVVKEMLRFDIDIENHYMYIPKYGVVKKIIDLLSRDKVQVRRVYTDILDAFKIEYEKESESVSQDSVIVWDKMSDETDSFEVGDNNVLINVDSAGDYGLFGRFATVQNIEHWVCIRIRKVLEKKNFVTNPKNEYIWVYTKNPEERNKIKNIKERIDMENTGMMLDIDAITDDKEMKIKLLEGNLQAALNRIEKYKEAESKYKEEIARLQSELAQQK